MNLIEKLKDFFGDLFGDINLIEKLQEEEERILKLQEKLVEEELKAAARLLDWAEGQEKPELAKGVKTYYDHKTNYDNSSTESLQEMRTEFLGRLIGVSDRVEELENTVKEFENAQKGKEKAEKNLTKKEMGITKAKGSGVPEKITKAENDFEVAKKDLEDAEALLKEKNGSLDKEKDAFAKFKYESLRDAYTKMNEIETKMHKEYEEVMDIRNQLVELFNNQL